MADKERPNEKKPAAGGADAPDEKKPAAPAAGTENVATVIEIKDSAAGSKADGGKRTPAASGAKAADANAAADANEEDLRYRNSGQVAKSGLLGAFIGLAIIVPGVSGSAVAIIFRLYEKLLYALGNLLRKFKRCALFLLPVAVGAVIGLVLGFFGVRALLGVLPFATVALFAGLMLGAFPAVTDQFRGEKLTPWRGALFALGLVLPVALSAVSVYAAPGSAPLENLQVWHYLLFLLLGWLVALTQLVPGLSATALLMMFGYFTPLLDSVSLTYWQSNPHIFLVYLCLLVGFIAGLLTVSKLLSRLVARRRAPTFYAVAGLSLGSAVTMFFNPEIMEVYRGWAGGGMGADLGVGIALFIAGIVAAYFFVRCERRHRG